MIRLHSTLLCAALFVSAVPPSTVAAQTETENVHRVVALAPGGTVKVRNFSGYVRITGTDRPEVVIDAVRRATRDRLDRIKLDVQATDSTVTIEANKREGAWWDRYRNNVVETELDIQVPRRTRLDVSVFSSPVRIGAVEGPHDVHGFSSEIVLTGVTRAVTAKTFSGDIDIEMAEGAPAPELDLNTFSGDIDVRVPTNARGHVDFNSFSGDLTSDLPLTLSSKRRHRLSAELGSGDTRVERDPSTGSGPVPANDFRFRTFSGDVRIKK